MHLIHDQAIAIVPSVLNPVFETVTGEVPASFSLSPRPDDRRVWCRPSAVWSRRKSSPMTA